MTTPSSDPTDKKQRRYVKQTEVPRVSLADALRIPRAIADAYAKAPTKPLDVAIALDLSPTSGTFRDLCGAAIGYGLTDGGPNASAIELTPLGRRVVAPTQVGDDDLALREAALTPIIMRQFLEKYDGNALPPNHIAYNVLEDMGVDRSRVEEVLATILGGAKMVGFLKPVKDKTYVDLDSSSLGVSTVGGEDAAAGPNDTKLDVSEERMGDEAAAPTAITLHATGLRNRRVYISHGKSRKVVDHLKEIIRYGEFEPIVSVEVESTSKPVPQKVMDEMRSCSAGIIHVAGEEKLIDQKGDERPVLNQNVLIEIGAAMALYGERFILLVEEGTDLPSNLQGLYEVRYSGDQLDGSATMRLLKVINEFKSTGPAVAE